MFKTSCASVALVAVLASLLGGAAATPILAVREDAAPARPEGLTLRPASSSDGSPSNLDLATEARYIWAHDTNGLVGNMSVIAAEGFRLLHSEKFADEVQSLDCTSSAIQMRFKTFSSMGAAEKAWAWVNSAAENTVVYIADGGHCGGQFGRQPYHVKSISYSNKTATATMAASLAKWEDFIHDAELRLHTPKSSVQARQNAGPQKVSKSATIDVGHDFSGTIFSTTLSGVQVGLDCWQCKTTGELEMDLTLSSSSGFSGSLTTTNNFGVGFGVKLSASAKLTETHSTGSVQLASVPLGGIELPGLASLTPEIALDASATVTEITGQISAAFGVWMNLPDGSGFGLNKQPSHMQAPIINPMTPDFSASVTVSAQVGPIITLDLNVNFAGQGMSGGIALEAPTILAIATAGADSNNGACGGNKAGLGLDLSAGVSLYAFGGVGVAKDEPNKTPLFTKNFPLMNECIGV